MHTGPDQMATALQRTIGLSADTAARITDIGLAAERDGMQPWPAIGRAVQDATVRGEAWALEATWPEIAKLNH